MKKYTIYTPVTPREALLALAENDGQPIHGFAFRSGNEKWKHELLVGYDGVARSFASLIDARYTGRTECARAEEVNPRAVPEEVTPLPESKPWLAYVPKVLIDRCPCDFTGVYTDYTRGEWDNCHGFLHLKGGNHLAIDVRTAEAKEHFQQIVEAMEYTEEPVAAKANSDEVFDKLVEGIMFEDARERHIARRIFNYGIEFGQYSPIQ